MSKGKRRGLLVGVLVTMALTVLGASPAYAQVIESKYQVRQPGTIVYDNDDDGVTDACRIGEGPGGHPFTLVYPASLGTDGQAHPVVVWGNGTAPGNDPVCIYRAALEHLASWGFVVVAPNDPSVGSGVEMRTAAEEMISRNDDPASRFYGSLDTSSIAAAGHSQGADGAVNAATSPGNPFTSVLAISIADRWFVEEGCTRWAEVVPWLSRVATFGTAPFGDFDCSVVPDPSQLTVPTFFVRGVNDCAETHTYILGSLNTILTLYPPALWPADWPDRDMVVSVRDELPDCASTPETNQEYYDAVPGPAAKGTVCGAGWETRGGCLGGTGAAHVDVSRATGYNTAWLAYTLAGSAFPDARDAFAGDVPEIATNGGWQAVATKNLP